LDVVVLVQALVGPLLLALKELTKQLEAGLESLQLA
jgi:uncharacterized membrane protein